MGAPPESTLFPVSAGEHVVYVHRRNAAEGFGICVRRPSERLGGVLLVDAGRPGEAGVRS